MGSTIKAIGGITIFLGIIGSIICGLAMGGAGGFGFFIGGSIGSVITGIVYIGVGEAVEDSRTAVERLNLMKHEKDNAEIKKLVKETNSTLISVNAKLSMLNINTNTSTNNYNGIGTSSQSNTTIAVEPIVNTTIRKIEKTQEPPMWKCPNCNNFNFANSNECMNCHTKVKFK
ncbi:MAG: Ran-binding zinc finger domain-containing protein [Acutalibacteraceae bacterium]|nr:Ran-binding zinc finger domain-containing protein [Acutalibacteraceae bacterium]